MEKNRSRKHKFILYLSDNEDRIWEIKYGSQICEANLILSEADLIQIC